MGGLGRRKDDTDEQMSGYIILVYEYMDSYFTSTLPRFEVRYFKLWNSKVDQEMLSLNFILRVYSLAICLIDPAAFLLCFISHRHIRLTYLSTVMKGRQQQG